MNTADILGSLGGEADGFSAYLSFGLFLSAEALALSRVRRIKGFYIHLFQFVAVVAVLAAINVIAHPRHLWVVRVALGWGIGVLVHGLRAFDKVPFLTADLEKRKVERYLGRQI